MGSGGSKAHEAFTIAPATTTADVADPDPLPDEVAATLEVLSAVQSKATSGTFEPADYEAMTAAVAQLQPHVDGHPDLAGDIKNATVATLTALQPQDLQELAAAAGFDHPQLVGLSDSSNHPLVHWLDPAYPDTTASKAAIQAKATERYQQLAAGATIGGLTIADIDTPPAKDGAWEATPAQVVALAADISSAALATHDAAQASQIVQNEATLHAVACPELGESLGQLQAATAATVSAHLAATPALRQQLVDDGVIPAHAAALNAAQALALARAATAASEREQLDKIAKQRSVQYEALKAATAAGWDSTSTLPDVDGSGPGDVDQVLDWVHNAAGHANLQSQVSQWAGQALPWKERQALGVSPGGPAAGAKQLTSKFRGWAKTRPIGHLRQVAGQLGMTTDHTKTATRAQLQNFIASNWDANHNAASIIDFSSTPKVTTPAMSSVSPGGNAASLGTAGGAGTSPVAVKAASYAGTLNQLKAKLRAHQALAADLPAAVSPAQVASHDWGTGTTFSKGSHASTVHTGPDGNQWMFKPDKSAGGARAHAEAVASKVYRRVGIPGVPVHVTTVAGKVGCVQPLVAGAQHISASPSSWSQADVDSIVALQAAAWVVGDHDAHPANVLRSPSGGVFPVDQGQAFKFYGKDKLTPSWHPKSNYGQPVYQSLYQAATTGKLGPGVRVKSTAALPVIKAFEAIDDADYRTMLAPVASHGVAHGVEWVPAMTKAAAKTHATTTPTGAQIADAFLDHAVARKNKVRAHLHDLFAGLELDDADHLHLVA